MRAKQILVGIVLTLSLAFGATTNLSAQGGNLGALIENFWRLISTGGRTFTKISVSGGTITGVALGATTITCNGSTGTSSQVLIGGNPCTWTGSPSITSLTVASAGTLGWSDVPIVRDAANIPALRNGTNAQQFRIYGTFTDASNYQRLNVGWDSGNGVYVVQGAHAGTGSAQELRVLSDGILTLGSGGHGNDGQSVVFDSGNSMVFIPDNTLDIGRTASLRPRNLFVGTNVTAGSAFVSSGTGLAVANVGANSCGTTAATIAGGNNAFVITVGATSGTQCRVTFTFAAANEWDCAANDDTTTVAVRVTPVDTTHTDVLGTFTAGDKVSGVCFPR